MAITSKPLTPTNKNTTMEHKNEDIESLRASNAELLEALKNMEDVARKLASWNGNDISDLDDEFDGVFDKARAAIAKATNPK